MTALDIFVFLLLIGGGAVGVVRGFVHELISLLAWIVAVAMLKLFHSQLWTGIINSFHTSSAAAAVRFFKVEPESLLIVHDDVDLEPGRLQARRGGGLAGHNGLRSLAQYLGTQEFLRLRIGVGRPARGDPRSVSDWVLSGFDPEDDVEALVSRAADAAETIVRDGLEAAQARFN